ncbi:hypothetical protein F0562_033960 [Nyssa sinensis]|uniref:Uncharacterized protein n=1 Tax=Nyssa sinensis TaxID=561372 RepID=A0A5J5AJB1_9ASTE|nr:hypothetical protein F0562_033960 [Nyssa sinensis]
MKERGKAVETYSGANYFSDYNYSASSDLPCKKHPSSSSVGICAYCLKDRLIKLVCSDCGEQRLSSCSCSEISSYPNSCSVEVGSVGRISFLIENDRTGIQHSHSKPQNGEKSEEVVMLKRSNSSCVDVKRSGFWRIGSFRGGGYFNDPDHEGSDFAFSSAKISDANGCMVLDSGRQSGFNEAEPRKSGSKGVLESENGFNLKGVKNGGLDRSVFPVKESDFNDMDESGFIDLKLDLSSESKPEFSVSKMSNLSESDFDSLRGVTSVGLHECGGSFGSVIGGDGVYSRGSSCRITVNDRGIKKGRKGEKVWRWIVSHHPGWKSASKKDEFIS